MAPINLSLAAQYKGDTWKGFSVDSISIDGASPTANLASVKLQFRSETGELGYELNTVSSVCKGLIVIDDAAIWGVTINPVVLPLDAEMWWWDLEMTDVNGVVFTPLKGRLRITADITVK